MTNRITKQELIGLSPDSKKFKQYKDSLKKLSQIQLEASIGLMLGDASLQTQNKGKAYRMKFEWGNRHIDYVNHVYNLFDEWVISKPHEKTRISPKNNIVTNWGFQTISHEAFNLLADLFINNSKKSVIINLISNHLTPVGLAYWFMDDGGKLDYNPNSKNKSIVLDTQSFTSEEVSMMSNELEKKFNLGCEVRSNKGKKVIVLKNYGQFIFLTGNHIIPEMRFKLPKS